MGMFTAAFDGAGRETNQPIMVVAGFVSSAENWDEFSMLWNRRLQQDGLTYFHYKEFARWDADEVKVKRPMQRDLMKLISKYAYRKFGFIISVDECPQMLSDEWNIRAYALAAMDCVVQVDQWATSSERIRRSSIEYVFEDGDKGQGRLITLMQNCGLPFPLFRPGKRPEQTPSGNSIPPFVPLQAADWVAGEYFMEAQRLVGKASGKRKGPRWGFQEFETFTGNVRYATEAKDLSALEQTFEVLARTRYLKDVSKS